MTDFLQLFFSGLATGSIYALAALGFTLLWQASGTINFAQGEFVMLPAIVMVIMLHQGVALPLSFAVAVLASVLVLGWLFKRGLVDPLFKYGMMPIVVATIGLSIAMRNGVRAGCSAEPQPFPQIFPDKIFEVAGVTVSASDIGTFVFALALVLVVQAFLSRTVTGRAMQAVAQNTESASVLGINVPRMIFYTFAINAVLAAAAALLVTPTYLAKFDMGEGLGTKAFFAAIIGGFNNSRGALLGGLKKRHAFIALLVLALFAVAPAYFKNYGIHLFTTWLVFIIATMGLNLTVGYAGQKSLGHAAFFGIGAYTLAILLKAGISFWVGLPVGAAICFVVGLALGFPALRVQTIYLAFATLGFNTALWLVMRNEEWLTGGTFGINNIARPSLGSMSLDGNLAYYRLVLAFTVVMALLLWGLLRSPWGKAFTALRDNPIRAESLGIDTRGYTLMSFAIGAA